MIFIQVSSPGLLYLLLGQPERKTESARAFQAPFVPHLLMCSWPKQVTCQAHISLGEKHMRAYDLGLLL